MTHAERAFRLELLARGLKQCPRCGFVKSLTQFHRRRACKLDGRQTYCIVCRKAMKCERIG